MQRPMDDAQAAELRRMVREVSESVEARIQGLPAAAERVRRATQEVQIAAMGPIEYWVAELFEPVKSVCMVIAQELDILPRINKSSGNITAAEVAEQVGADELLISRVMRVLTCVGIADETGPNTYQGNELSKLAASSGGKAGVKIHNELLFPIATQIVPYMRDHGFKQFPRRPQELGPTEYTFDGKTMFEYFKTNPEFKNWFDTLMAENRKGNTPWFQIYPFADELGDACANQPETALLVDVGGNRGGDILEFRRAYPDLPGRFVLQDLPETISGIDRSSMEGIELQPYDFFTPQPVKGAKAYFWRWVLHDFDDDSVRNFLSNTVKAMDKESRLLVEELVLPDVCTDVKCSHLDILMMLYHSGMERTLIQWRKLLDSCGLEIVKVWSRPDTDPSILECKLKPK